MTTDWPEVETRLRFLLEALTARQAWLPIESAPRDGTKVDLWIGQFPRQALVATEPHRAADCWFSGGEWWVYDERGEDEANCRTSIHGATHWLPLPAPLSLAPKEPTDG